MLLQATGSAYDASVTGGSVVGQMREAFRFDAIQNAEGEGRYCGEVHRSECLTMIPEERKPAFGGIRISRDSPKPSRDSGFRQMEAQLEQFAVNARRVFNSKHSDYIAARSAVYYRVSTKIGAYNRRRAGVAAWGRYH